MASQSAYVPLTPSPRLRDTHTDAPAELVKLRVQHLLPHTTRRAKARVDALKQLFATPTTALLAEQAAAMDVALRRLRLVKSVRNLRVQGSGGSSNGGVGGGGGGGGALCLPLHSCAALPALTADGAATALSCVLTGSVDGLLTLWDAEQCTPLSSQSTFPDGRTWGRVKSIAVYPSHTRTMSGNTCVAFTATMFQSAVRVWRIRADAACTQEENEDEQAPSTTVTTPSASLEPLTTTAAAAVAATSERVGGLQSVAVDPTGALLAATHDSGLVHVWDARSCINGDAISAAESTAASAAAAAPASSPLLYLYTQDGYETAGAALGLAFHPDGSLLTTTDAGGRVVAFDTRSGRLAFHTGGRVGAHLRSARCLAWSPCGVRLASGGDDGVVQIYDARKLSRAGPGVHKDGGSSAAPFMLLGHEDAVTSVSFYANPLRRGGGGGGGGGDGPSVLPVGLVTTSLDQTLRVWDADTGLCAKVLEAGTPLQGHCRPALQPLAPARFAASTAVVAVGHGKNWLLYDVGLRGDALEAFDAPLDDVRGGAAAAGVRVQETDIVASLHGATGSMKFSVGTSGVSGQVGTSAPGAGGGADSGAEEDDSSEEEEDEMMALMKKPAAAPVMAVVAAAPPPSQGKKDDDDEEEEDSSEDEMEALKKRAAAS